MAKTYVGNGRKRNDKWLKASICLTDALQFGKVSQKNGKTYVNIDINVKDQPDQYNNDVSISIDEYVSQQGAGSQRPTATPAMSEATSSAADDLPF